MPKPIYPWFRTLDTIIQIFLLWKSFGGGWVGFNHPEAGMGHNSLWNLLQFFLHTFSGKQALPRGGGGGQAKCPSISSEIGKLCTVKNGSSEKNWQGKIWESAEDSLNTKRRTYNDKKKKTREMRRIEFWLQCERHCSCTSNLSRVYLHVDGSCAAPTSVGQSVRYHKIVYSTFSTRETREGWSLLTVESEVNGNSKSTNERVPSLVGSLGLVLPVQQSFVLPWLL
jgi:hypothetical protein